MHDNRPYDDHAQIRETLADMERVRAIPDTEFPGHKGIYLANLEGFLGGRVPALLVEIERLAAALAAVHAPEGIETHIGHRVSLVGGEDALLGLMCEDCGEYLVEWE